MFDLEILKKLKELPTSTICKLMAKTLAFGDVINYKVLLEELHTRKTPANKIFTGGLNV
jgi:ribonuclease D